MNKLFIYLIVCLLPLNLWATIRYVDNTGVNGHSSTWNGSNGASYNPNAGGTPATGVGYTTIQLAITATVIGDTIYMRGGTFHETGIVISHTTQNGTSWSPGYFTTLTSYPGEWAIVTGDNTGEVGITCSSLNDDHNSWNLAYWRFERFEVTGNRVGFWMNGGPMQFRYMYIHDNSNNHEEDIQGGLVIRCPRDTTIEYCYFKDNQGVPTIYGNDSSITFVGDYLDSTGNGGTFVPTEGMCRNILRYNYFTGTVQAFRHKGDQRFGYNNRNPDPTGGNLSAYVTWGDDIHHNIIVNQSFLLCQDFAQFHNNILDNCDIQSGKNENVPPLYNICVYNNTLTGASAFIRMSSGWGIYNDGVNYTNYYDNGSQHTCHPWFWTYNNISDGAVASDGDHEIALGIAMDVAANSTNPDFNYFNSVADRNLIHDDSDSSMSVRVGRLNSGTGCNVPNKTIAAFNSCSDTWRGLAGGTVKNWRNTTASLFTSGYLTNSSFIVSGSTTIANGGIGGDHPYLTGVTIPSYVGATNPSDNSWVAGVLALGTTYFTSATAGSTPSWIEGSGTPTAPTSVPTIGIGGFRTW